MNTADLVDLWQHGMGRSSVERGLALASCASPTAASEPIGLRNKRILQWRERLFGTQIEAVAQCPLCSSYVEASFTVEGLPEPSTEAIHELTAEGFTIKFRLPTSLDLAYLMRFTDEVGAEQALVHRCVLKVKRKGRMVTADKLTAAAVDALSQRMDELDPYAYQQVTLECPNCSHRWFCLFDVAAFTWREISGVARRSLRDVHELARAYGWTEAEVFALPAARRQMYLEMVRA